jgi:beta-N-acetylhexosaminidase
VGASAAIYGLSGPYLLPAERDFFRGASPWGFILFARNVQTPDQLKRLTGDLRDTVGYDAPVLIDQEGGRVQRLRAPHWREWEPVRELCEATDCEFTLLQALRERYAVIAAELIDVGIDVNCVPVLDVPQQNAHPIIGDRAFGRTGSEIALRAREAAAGLMQGGVLPVIKHLPGHGRALTDSHEELPMVTASLEELRATDFLPFLSMRDAPLGMTAHVTYTAIDPDACATLSPAAIGIIREVLGFDGLLMTDDLSMKALSGPMDERTRAALSAGCDLILHCNGEMSEMEAIASTVPEVSGQAARRVRKVEDTRARLKGAEIIDTAFIGKVVHG